MYRTSVSLCAASLHGSCLFVAKEAKHFKNTTGTCTRALPKTRICSKTSLIVESWCRHRQQVVAWGSLFYPVREVYGFLLECLQLHLFTLWLFTAAEILKHWAGMIVVDCPGFRNILSKTLLIVKCCFPRSSLNIIFLLEFNMFWGLCHFPITPLLWSAVSKVF